MEKLDFDKGKEEDREGGGNPVRSSALYFLFIPGQHKTQTRTTLSPNTPISHRTLTETKEI